VRRAGVEPAGLPAEGDDIALLVVGVGAVEVAEPPLAGRLRRRAVGALGERRVPERRDGDDVEVRRVARLVQVDVVESADVAEVIVERQVAGGIARRRVVRRRWDLGLGTIADHDAVVRPLHDDVVAGVRVEAGAGDVDGGERRIERGVGGDLGVRRELRAGVHADDGNEHGKERRDAEPNPRRLCHTPP